MISALISALLSVVTLQPASLPAGPHPSGPHVERRVLHDGEMRMAFRAPRVEYLGALGDRYVVRLSRADGSNVRVMWIRADESQKVLARGSASYDAVVSSDGKHLLTTPSVTRRSTTVRVQSVASGDVVATHRFRGSVSVLDASDGRAVLGGWSPNRTFWWTFDGGSGTELINHRVGYIADIAADRVASYTRDPYNDGCSVLSDLSSARLLRSCSERVTAISPSGSSVATIHILSDGLGPSTVKTRDVTSGSALATYEAPYYFGSIRWETDTSLLMDTYGKRRWATVRCELDDCERASKVYDTPRLRVSVGG